ncbi:2OG-Fe(II) oxygenase [Sphingomonas sp. LB-2]|uniref:2OG-Fe(II) oxygenase n=1 Tax=Sphingomonas caeni TaxID=2984949 RepID=UPI00222F94DA|nr:2OG-Fe(II) oxygenase [Sphingomonas caeni]MCW3847875.1 2OG-Fe(II) oxygenase [Sphingomonas caeni]
MEQHPDLARAVALWDEGRQDEAIPLIARHADLGDPDAMFALADIYWQGAYAPRDGALALGLFRQASNAGHAVSGRAYTNLLANGAGGVRDWPQAMARLRFEAQSDSRRAHMLRLIEAMPLTPTGFVATVPRGQRICERPEILHFQHLFTPEECDYLVEVAEPDLAPAMVMNSAGQAVRDPVRTADGFAFHILVEDPATHALNRRLAAASNTRHEQGEPLWVLRYQPGQEYRPHLDAIPGFTNQRILTALVYLNDDYEGGATLFTKAGVEVKGRKGDAIVFRNTIEGSRADPMSEHAGMPVTSGTKYLASRWICERRHVPRPDEAAGR